MMPSFNPMLAGTADDPASIRFPVLASPKLDGIRAVVKNGVLLSRSLKPIQNAHVQSLFGRPEYEGFDGELIDGPPTATDVFRSTGSSVMSRDGTPDVKFYVFDSCSCGFGFESRYEFVVAQAGDDPGLVVVPQLKVRDVAELAALEERWLAEGYEGVMIRDPQGGYKYGRSTAKEQGLLKIKRFEDAEAVVTGFDEQLHNGNEAFKNELGYTERCVKLGSMTGAGVLGSLRCVGLNGTYKGTVFNIGTGLNYATRTLLWEERGKLLGRIVKYKYFPSGSKDAPRFPVFLGFRNTDDLDQT